MQTSVASRCFKGDRLYVLPLLQPVHSPVPCGVYSHVGEEQEATAADRPARLLQPGKTPHSDSSYHKGFRLCFGVESMTCP